jgi:8-oxo-dGTP pyrophosphatase MutT (NUDIX family)
MMTDSDIELILAAGGIVIKSQGENSEIQVLMIFRNGTWDLPKGKLEKGESIEMCAAREVAEEVGSGIPAIIKKIGTTYHEYPEKDKVMGKTTHWYSMVFTREEELVPQVEEGIEKIKWMGFSEAVEKAGFENLKEILKKFNP